jgi:hypothetical protein
MYELIPAIARYPTWMIKPCSGIYVIKAGMMIRSNEIKTYQMKNTSMRYDCMAIPFSE